MLFSEKCKKFEGVLVSGDIGGVHGVKLSDVYILADCLRALSILSLCSAWLHLGVVVTSGVGCVLGSFPSATAAILISSLQLSAVG
jgi:hypothetical protein